MKTFQQFFEAQERQIAYHVTFRHLLPKIKREGLTPHKPEDVEDDPNDPEGVYLFPTKEDLVHALQNWLGERTDEMEEKAGFKFEDLMLTVDITGLRCSSTVEWEVVCLDVIPPNRILKVEKA